MLGSIQSRRCNLGFGLAFFRALCLRADPGRKRSRRDWTMDSHSSVRCGSSTDRFSLSCLLVVFPQFLSSLGGFTATAGLVGLLIERLVDLCPTPEAMEQDGEFACHRDERSLLGVLAAPRGHLQPEATQITVGPEWPEDVVSGVDQQSP